MDPLGLNSNVAKTTAIGGAAGLSTVHKPRGSISNVLRTLLPKAIQGMVFGNLGPGSLNIGYLDPLGSSCKFQGCHMSIGSLFSLLSCCLPEKLLPPGPDMYAK